jgi:hypothetical protein
MRWERECGAPAAACPHRMNEVSGSVGVTALSYCRRDGGQACPALVAREHAALGEVAGCAIVAGNMLDRLRGRRCDELWDVLPAIRDDEWEIVLAFVRDYTARRVPWALVRRGQVWAVIKLKG